MVVFEPAFCDQSRKTLPERLDLVIVAVTSFGCSPCSSSAISLASAVDVVGVAAAAAGGRRGACPCCRWSPGGRRASRSASLSRTSSATWQHSCSPAGSPGSRSITSRSAPRGLPCLVDRPLVHVQLEGGEVGQPGEGGEVVDDREDQAVAVPALAARAGGRARRRCAPSDGVPAGAFFSKKRSRLDAVRPADPGDRAVLELRQQHRRDLGVVVEHLALGGAGARVEHLVEVATA